MRYLPWQFSVCSALFALTGPFSQAAKLDQPAVLTAPASLTGIHAVTNVADGQAGYVHYFLITHPDGTPEDQVGIELEDQRIAWSFPGAGVIVSEFVRNGALDIAGKTFFIEHLHGIRPFRTAGEMQSLRKDLSRRVAYWVDEETPYCIFRQPGERLCLNCGDFVAHILFPATNTLMAGLPAEFTRNPGNMVTADDLLIYMLGLHKLPDAKTRLQKLATMDLPYSLRRDVAEMLQADQPALAAATEASTAGPAPARKPVSRIAIRRTQSRRL
ncbi:MAG: hypothetical protein K2X06_13510 [Burkholderiales bacterium]|nr:hypothetical protein [Burkholderiales bacterium]